MPPREMLTRLVAFDTTSALSNLPFIDFVRDYLDTYGIASQLTTDDTGNKANLFATVGPADRGGVVLSGHSDVVPVAGQEWHSDPFAVAEREGRLHGRGTADMKGFIAIALALVPEMVARRDQLEIPVHLAISYDEEVGCIGVRRLIDGLIGPRPRLVVVGEPTDLQVIDTHKGIDAFQTRIRGRAAHSSAPELGASAIALAGEIVQFIYRLSAELRDATTTPAFDPPYTTMNVGTISGGTAVNIIAQDCTLQWEYRALPGVDPAAIETRVRGFIADELLPRARAHCPEVEIVTERQSGVPAFSAVPGSPACSLALDLCQATDTGAVCFATEAGLFEAAGMPSVVWGPGSISEAHRPDEHITVAQFERGTEMIQRIIAWAQDPRSAALTG